MAISPVRTISTSPWGRTIRSKASDRTSVRRPLPIPRSRAPRRDSVVTTGDGDLAGADHFDQPVGADHPLEGLRSDKRPPPPPYSTLESPAKGLSRDHGRWRSRRCGPFRPARGGGPSARRPQIGQAPAAPSLFHAREPREGTQS